MRHSTVSQNQHGWSEGTFWMAFAEIWDDLNIGNNGLQRRSDSFLVETQGGENK